VPVGVVETEELGALELEAEDAPAPRLEGGPDDDVSLFLLHEFVVLAQAADAG
jgi:hypothetical protein